MFQILAQNQRAAKNSKMKDSKLEKKSKNSKKIDYYTARLKDSLLNKNSREDYIPYAPQPPIIPSGGAMNYSAGGMLL